MEALEGPVVPEFGIGHERKEIIKEVRRESNGVNQLHNELTPEQKDMVKQLREKVLPMLKPEQDDERFLVKWLKARNFDLEKAEDMLKKHLKFMKINGLENIIEDYVPHEVINYFYTAVLGYDKEGSVVRILHLGLSDLRGISYSISKLEALKCATYTLASDVQMQKKERTNDTICDKQVYIIDFKDLSWRTMVQRPVIDKAFYLLKSYEANYPENLKVAYLVNAPSSFNFIYNWLKTVLPESIISKLDIVAPDECQSKLSKVMDLSIVPASLGGTRRDPDGNPNCNSLYARPLGTPLPESLLSTDHHETLKNDPDARRVTVNYKSVFVAEKVVSEPNSILQWDFQTADYDIRMGLRYKQDENSTSEEIIPPHRVDSHIMPESGKFSCEKAGIYELVFDNCYSWLTSKELVFKVSVESPDNNIEN